MQDQVEPGSQELSDHELQDITGVFQTQLQGPWLELLL